MAIYHQDIADIELNSGSLHRSFLDHSIGLGDAAANRFGVRVFRNGVAETLSGVTCQGFFRNANGENIALTSYGTIDGNVAYVTLPQACYNIEGMFTLAIKLVGGGVTGTMRIIDGMVDNTNTGGAVAPTGSVPTYQEVLSVYEQMQVAVTNYDAKVTEQDGKISDLKSALDAIQNTENLFNASTASTGRLDTTGRFVSADGYFTSDYIPVEVGLRYFKNSPIINAYHRICTYAYSGQTTAVRIISDSNYLTIQSGEAFVRFCGLSSESSTAMLYRSTAVDEVARATGDMIKTIVKKSVNLHDTATDHNGYYFNVETYIANANYNATDKVQVEVGKTYYFSNDGNAVRARYVAFYTLAGNYLSGSDVQNVESVTIGNNIGSIVVSFSVNYNKFQIEADAVSQYVPFGKIYITVDDVEGIEELDNKNKRTDHPLFTDDYPTSLRTGYKVIFSGEITDGFTAFTIQRGASASQIEQITVGVTALRYNCGGTVISENHGLTWANKCYVIVESTDLAHTKITLITNGGHFTHVFERPKGFGNNGTWTSTDTMGGTLVQQINKPNDIWIIGDSYMSYADDRIGGALYEIGQESPTILSVPGATTATMAEQLKKMIDCYHVVPSIVCICTGINDNTAEAYQTGLNTVMQYAAKYGFEIAVTVIPITPDRAAYNEIVRNYILSLNYKKIRFDEAVGATTNSGWYAGCINSDNLHPSQAGARLLVAEIIKAVGYLCD